MVWKSRCSLQSDRAKWAKSFYSDLIQNEESSMREANKNDAQVQVCDNVFSFSLVTHLAIILFSFPTFPFHRHKMHLIW